MKKIFIAIIPLWMLGSCHSSDNESIEPLKQQVVNNYATLALANYEDAITLAKQLQTKIHSFVASPSAQGLQDCKTAWISSRVPYLQTEAFRFYDGPIDESTDNYEGLINSWPLDESNIDYYVKNNVAGGEIIPAGVINDVTGFPSVTEKALLDNNGKNGETDVKVGYHAIEFLLWGQDLYTDSPGKRPYTDYVKGGTALNQDRRGQYLTIVADLLVKDLEAVKAQWETTGAYRKTFTDPANLTQSLTDILNGMGKLAKGELSGERMAVLLASQDQEDEHSCFSDNTNNDYLYDATGIYNVYLGKYTRTDGTVVDGAGFDDLLKIGNSGINTTMIAKLDASMTAIKALPVPIDQGVITGQPLFKTAINALRAAADQLVIVGNTIGINLNIPESNG